MDPRVVFYYALGNSCDHYLFWEFIPSPPYFTCYNIFFHQKCNHQHFNKSLYIRGLVSWLVAPVPPILIYLFLCMGQPLVWHLCPIPCHYHHAHSSLQCLVGFWYWNFWQRLYQGWVVFPQLNNFQLILWVYVYLITLLGNCQRRQGMV